MQLRNPEFDAHVHPDSGQAFEMKSFKWTKSVFLCIAMLIQYKFINVKVPCKEISMYIEYLYKDRCVRNIFSLCPGYMEYEILRFFEIFV